MTGLVAATQAPTIDFQGLSPVIAVAGGACLVLMLGLIRPEFVQRVLIPFVAFASLAAATGLSVYNWDRNAGDSDPIISGVLGVDALALGLSILFFVAGMATVLLSVRSRAQSEAGSGEYYALLLASIVGMVVLAGAEDLIVLFVGIELLSIPLYVLCAAEVRRAASLESGLKYLVIGSVGSATLLYGLALVFGAAGSTNFADIQAAIGDTIGISDPLLLAGIALTLAGLAFKASVAPFHQWTPDVYEGAPSPITAFMAVATKAAAFAIILRVCDLALLNSEQYWAPALATLAAVTIIVGNVGALAQRSVKRMLGWSGVAQAGYLLVGVVVTTKLGLQATAFYLAVYLLMNVGAFAVVIARERATETADDLDSFRDLGRANPWLAWPLTIAMLSLAGFPVTAGFIGKFYLINAAVDGDYAWLGFAIVIGSIISLGYYLRLIAVMWMGRFEITLPTNPPRTVRAIGGWSPEGDAKAQPEVLIVALLATAATLFFGIWPDPLFDLARDVGQSFSVLD